MTGSFRRFGCAANVSLMIASVLAGLLLLEIGMRVWKATHPQVTLAELESHLSRLKGREASLGDLVVADHDPRLVYSLIPNLSVSFGGHELRTNSAGFRDDEFTTAAQAGTVRVAVLGDSGSFGWKVGQRDGYPEALEQVLNECLGSAKISVMNFSVPGYNTVMEREVFEKHVLGYNPQVLIVQFDGNDIDLPNFMKKRDNPWRIDRSYVWDYIRARRLRWLGDRAGSGSLIGLEGLPMGRDATGNQRFFINSAVIPPEMRDLAGEDNCLAAIRAIGETCRTRGIAAIFLMNPNVVDWENAPLEKDQSWAIPFVNEARRAGFLVADPTLAIRKFLKDHGLKSPDLWIEPESGDAHAGPARHTLIAMELEQMLEGLPALSAVLPPSKYRMISEAFHRRAEAQWQSQAEERLAGKNVKLRKIVIGKSDEDAPFLGEGWHAPEKDADGAPYRWTMPEAHLSLPRIKRLVVAVWNKCPPRIGPPDQEFLINGKSMPYTLMYGGGYTMINMDISRKARKTANPGLDVIIRSKPVELAGAKLERELGLMVYWIAFEEEK
ncbi:MAG: SGNH/GDSL hydrolase family protein [bacterium]